MRANPILMVVFFGTLAFAGWWFRPWADSPPRLLFFNEAVAAPAGAGLYKDGADGFAVEVMAEGLQLPWDIAFIGDKEILVTEKRGGFVRIDLATGQKTGISGVPEVAAVGQGGLHAVTLHPQFATDGPHRGLIYLSYAARGDGGGNTTRLLRARLDGNALSEQKLLFSAVAESRAGHHFGGALVFDQQGFLYLSIGDRGDRDKAQDLSRHNGKIVRLKDDGSVPDDNPFRATAGALPEIWSYGHRNSQGMGIDAATGQLWSVEHGPRGGDELNRVERGRNYGWPVITYGKEYVGGSIGEGTSKAGMEQPVHYYVPSIATGGMSYYQSDYFPQWKDSVFIASLKDNHLNRVQLRDDRFVKEERLLRDRGLRLRSVKLSPRGEVWVVSDDGVLLRLVRPTDRS